MVMSRAFRATGVFVQVPSSEGLGRQVRGRHFAPLSTVAAPRLAGFSVGTLPRRGETGPER